MSTSLNICGIIQLAVIMERFTIHKLHNIQAGQYIYLVSLYSAGESYQVEAGRSTWAQWFGMAVRAKRSFM